MKLKELNEAQFANIDDKLPAQSANENVIADAQSAAEMFNNELATLFGNEHFVMNAKVTKILGPVLAFTFYDKYVKVTKLNSPVNVNFIMVLTDNTQKSKDQFEIDLTTWSFQLKNAGVKYRKIKGKTPTEATKKLVDWFKKNSNVFIEIFSKNVMDV